MKEKSYVSLLILSIIAAINSQNNTNINDSIILNCSLLEIQYTEPKPSLSKCYRYNTGSCCNSVHDDKVKSELAELLTSSCLIKYPSLIDLFCMGCSPFQPYFTDIERKTIQVCKSYVESLWIPSENINNTITLDTVSDYKIYF